MSNSVCVAEGFTIWVDTYPYTQNGRSFKEVTPEEFPVPQATYDSMVTMRDLGFLAAPESLVFFTRKFADEDKRDRYTVVVDSTQGPDPFRFNVNVSADLVPILYGTQSDPRISIAEFKQMVEETFSDLPFTPVNGWQFMYFLDHCFKGTKAWTVEQIHAYDELVSAGMEWSALRLLIERDVPATEMANWAGLPYSWVKRAFPVIK